MVKEKNHRLRRCEERYDELKMELGEIGFVCLGSVQTRWIECGKSICRCHEDLANRHGPYHYWTRKARGKTVGLLLTEDELPIYRKWIKNSRRLERVLREMRKVSTRALALTTGRKVP